MANPFDGVTWPRLVVNAAFAAAPASVCVVDTGVVDTNVVGGRGMVDISADVRSVAWTRGRDSDIDIASPGTATIVLGNRSGDYDPTNLSGPYVSGGASLITLGAAVTIQAERPIGMLYDRFVGELVDISVDAGLDPIVTFTLVDGLEKLGRTVLPVEAAEFTGDTSGQRVGNILDRAGWPATARLIDTGTVTMLPTTLGASALELLRQVELSEFGLLYVDEHGNVVFYDRHRAETASRSAVVQAALTDTSGAGEVGMMELVLAKSRERVYNDVHVTRDPDPTQDPDLTGSSPGDVPVEQVAQDAASIAIYGTLSFPAQVGQLLTSDPDALALAEGIAGRYAQPQVRIREVRINALRGDLWSTLLPLGLLDRISVRRQYGDAPHTITAELLIQAITEEIGVSPARWELRWTTSEPPPLVDYCIVDGGVVDTSVVGW